ncbi:MAG: capsid cement protein [Phycisphaerales bacterium]
MIEGSKRTFTAGADLAAHRRVKLSGTSVVYAGDEEDAIGVTEFAALLGEDITVRLINTGGTFEVTAAGAIAAGGAVYPAADGKVEATGTNAKGTALDAATADGDIIECLLK